MSTGTVTARRSRSWTEHPDVRRLGVCLLVGVVVALMTGADGSATSPTGGITATFRTVGAYVCIVLSVVLWLGLTLQQRHAARITAVRSRVSARTAPLRGPRLRYPGFAVLLAIAAVLPLTVGTFWQEVLVGNIGIYVLLALGLNVVIGFAGLLDLGYIAFFAVGAYSTAYWTGSLPVQPPFHVNPFFTIPLAIIAAMIAGVVLGAPTLRLRGDYLAIVTLGFGEIVQIVANNLTTVTGGAQGPAAAVPPFSVHTAGASYTWPLELISHWPWYYLVLVMIVIVIVAFSLLENSRVGRAWVALREDEVAAEASGINALKYKVMAFAIGASTSGVAGAYYASKTGVFNPGDFTFQASVLVLVLVIFGGMGSIPGAVVGAAVLQFLPQLLRSHIQQQDLYIYVGALLIVMMIFRPQGVIPSRRRAREIGLAQAGIGSADALAAPGGAP